MQQLEAYLLALDGVELAARFASAPKLLSVCPGCAELAVEDGLAGGAVGDNAEGRELLPARTAQLVLRNAGTP